MTATLIVVKAESREPGRKGAARRLRRTGMVPAVAYGKGLAATPITVAPAEVLAVLGSEHGRNTVVDLKIANRKEQLLAMIRDYSYHPVKRNLEHVDFVEVKLDRAVEVEVPLFSTGKPVGVTLGGVLRQVFRTIPVRCLPDRIPVKVEIDVTHLKLNEHISTKDLKLAEGVEVRLPAEQTLIAVVAPEKEREEDAAKPAAAAAAAPAAGGAAAPAAAGAAKAAEPAKKADKK